jgi:hypothetical protein
MARQRTRPPNDDPAIDADLARSLDWIKGEGDKHAKLGEIEPLISFFRKDMRELTARTHGDHWVQRDRHLIAKEIERRLDRAIGVMIGAAQERGRLNHRGWANPSVPKLRNLIGNIDDQPMRIFASWPDEKWERILDVARKARVMSRPALLRVEAGEPASTKRKVIRFQIEDEATQRRIYNGAVTAMDGMAHALRQLGDIHPRIKQEEREQWLEQLNKHRAILSRAMHKLHTPPKPPSLPPSSTSR